MRVVFKTFKGAKVNEGFEISCCHCHLLLLLFKETSTIDVPPCAPAPGALAVCLEPRSTCLSSKAIRQVGGQRLAAGSVCRGCFAGNICILHDALAAYQTLADRMDT